MFGIVLILFVIIVVLLVLKSTRKTSDEEIGPFRPRRFLLSKAELSFYKSLNLYLPKNRIVMCKVGLKEVVDTASGEKVQRSKDWGRIKSKHLDFVIVNQDSSEILCCIELDDSSHNMQSVQKRDAIKDKALQSAGVKLHRVKASSSYSKEQILAILGTSEFI